MPSLLESIPLILLFAVVLGSYLGTKLYISRRAIRAAKDEQQRAYLQLHEPSRFNEPWLG